MKKLAIFSSPIFTYISVGLNIIFLLVLIAGISSGYFPLPPKLQQVGELAVKNEEGIFVAKITKECGPPPHIGDRVTIGRDGREKKNPLYYFISDSVFSTHKVTPDSLIKFGLEFKKGTVIAMQ
ncbi:MAG: hypothetical protein WCS86_00915 [Candidatus Paceibacterota bacterium]